MVSRRWRHGQQPSLDALSDAELIVASRNDADAFHHLYRRHADDLLAFFYRRTGNAQVAADLMAETFAVAFAKRTRFSMRPEGSGVGWLFGIARREAASYYRRRSVELRAVEKLGMRVPNLSDSDIERIEAMVDAESTVAKLEPAMGKLSEREREALHLRYDKEMAYDELAKETGATTGAARVRAHRGLQKLAGMIGQSR